MSNRFPKMWAKLVLASLFFLHLFRRVFLFWRRPPGLANFLENFSKDAIAPVSERERSLMPLFSRCQNCSLCTPSCVAIQSGRAPSGFEPKYLLLGMGRSSHESEYFLEEWIPCAECNECSVLCPNQVPVHQMAEVILERRGRIAFRK